MGWIKNQMMALSLALSSVEKNALSQIGGQLSDNTKMVQRHTQGMMYDSLINGELTEEVKLLRARLYKVIEATDNIRIKGVAFQNELDENPDDEFDENKYSDGVYTEHEEFNTSGVIVEVRDNKTTLSKVKLDSEDDYEPDMVIINEPHTLSSFEGLDINNKQFVPLVIRRSFHPRFLLENFITKLVVRKITDQEKLLEFYISKYPKEFDVNSKLFLKYFEKEKDRLKSDLFVMDGVEFITEDNDIGVDYGYLHEFDNLKIQKIIEFDGHYVVKYIGELTNVEDVRNFYHDEELDKKYANKEKRKKRGEK